MIQGILLICLRDKVQTDQVFPMTLKIVYPVFFHGNKWRFDDGEHIFLAAIEDEEFSRRVNNREGFAKGDFREVNCHFLQEIVNSRLKTTRTIKKVIAHTSPPVNKDLFLE